MGTCSCGAVLDVAILDCAVVAAIVPEGTVSWDFLLELEAEWFGLDGTFSFRAVA